MVQVFDCTIWCAELDHLSVWLALVFVDLGLIQRMSVKDLAGWVWRSGRRRNNIKLGFDGGEDSSLSDLRSLDDNGPAVTTCVFLLGVADPGEVKHVLGSVHHIVLVDHL